MKIHAATGVRTKNYHCFFESECVSVQKITMHQIDEAAAYYSIDGRRLGNDEIIQLVRNDGFLSYFDFNEWFQPGFSEKNTSERTYKLIHWTDFRY